MKGLNYDEVKAQETRRRVRNLGSARMGSRSASALQRRASLVGDGTQWRITNFRSVAAAMAKWA
jgi:hypothetical protein